MASQVRFEALDERIIGYLGSAHLSASQVRGSLSHTQLYNLGSAELLASQVIDLTQEQLGYLGSAGLTAAQVRELGSTILA
jgi:hypothetical protein